MPIFDDIGNFITKGSQDAIRKTKEVTDLARINSLISETQKSFDAICCQFGKLLFESGNQSAADAYPDLWANITQVNLRLQCLNQEKMKIKNVAACTNCHAEIAMNLAFCPNCGSKVVIKAVEYSGSPAPAVNQGMSFCSDCGQSIKSELAFCPHCGAKNE